MIINATLCYVRDRDHTLMLFRNKKPNDVHEGKWNGLGGKFINGESPEECALREIEEECGLKCSLLAMRGILTFPQFDGQNDWLVFVFEANQFCGELIESPEGRLEWIENERLMDLNLWEGDRIFLKWLDENRFFSGKFVYKKGILQHYDVVFY